MRATLDTFDQQLSEGLGQIPLAQTGEVFSHIAYELAVHCSRHDAYLLNEEDNGNPRPDPNLQEGLNKRPRRRG